jgi:hypothetical protein
MLPKQPPHLVKRTRGRQPPAYGPVLCPLCARRARMANFTRYVFHCECGWKSAPG